MGQQRNFVLFMVLSLVILVGWMWLQTQLWPPDPKKKDDAVADKKKDDKKDGKKVEQVKKEARWEDLTDLQKKLVAHMPLPMPMTLGIFAHLAPKEDKKEKEVPAETIAIGDPKKFHIHALLTTRGGGVQKLVLNRFKAANWLGQPTDNPLELVTEDAEYPSYLMYHFQDPDSAHPVLTLGKQIWKHEPLKVLEDGTHEIRFYTSIDDSRYRHIVISKTYRLKPREYHLGLVLEIKDTREKHKDAAKTKLRYQLAGAHGLPIEGEWYTATYRTAVIGEVDSSKSLVRTVEDSARIGHRLGGDKVPEGQRATFLQYAGVMNQYFGAVIVVDDKQPDAAAGGGDAKDILAWARPTHESFEIKGTVQELRPEFLILADSQGRPGGYYLLPRARKHIEEAHIKTGDKVVVNFYENDVKQRFAGWVRPGQTPLANFEDITVRVHSEPIELQPGEKVAHQFLLYHGPVKTKLLGQFSGEKDVDEDVVDRYTTKLHLRTLTDYRSPGPLGAFSQTIHFTDLLIAITSLMHWLLYWLHFLVGNYGLAIILLTGIVRGLMFPISKKQALFSARMQELAPELKKIKEKYANDRKAQSEAMMELYRKHKIHPLGGCLPLFLQLPIFLGLYYALQESIHFRLAGFLWMDNLAAPDMLFWWTESIPWISEPDSLGGLLYLGPFFNLLPICAVVLMLMQQKMMTPPPQDDQQAMQMKIMKYMMVFFGILFYKVASGLCIYFIASSLWGLAERKYLPKRQAAAAAAPPPEMKLGPGKQKGKGKGVAKKDEPPGTLQKVKNWWAEVLKQAKKK
ncbi:MAG: YidC/Oxa1 family insertase periplasmic-domain containing protein [Gemmataceae bacterium]|nr:YidC/Oxa1 family insertase periplasmic-domain containing protein [Gemmataceae bacterium]MCI0740145.1 YidC/Oxa1 family insertase periplasmic-domain containing protein [Gemmataceae bacterium]